MQRTILGILAIVLFATAAALRFFLADAAGSISLAFCWRMGLVTAAAWLAYHDIQRLPGWLLATLPIVLVVLARWPNIFLIIIPIVVVAAFFHSRLSRR
jgi:hypothetical protein